MYTTACTIRINQQALAETQRANREADQREREAQVTDRYTKAIGQLGDPQLAIRLGGIYALERVAVGVDRDHRTIVEVLSAFIRTSSRSPDNQSNAQPKEQPASAALPAGGTRHSLPTDVQAAVTVPGRLPSRPGVSRGDLTSAHLTGAQLNGTTLSEARLDRATLTDARLHGADLTDARLHGADLTTVKNLTQQLDSARGDDDTRLPAGLQRPAHWSTGPTAPPATEPAADLYGTARRDAG